MCFLAKNQYGPLDLRLFAYLGLATLQESSRPLTPDERKHLTLPSLLCNPVERGQRGVCGVYFAKRDDGRILEDHNIEYVFKPDIEEGSQDLKRGVIFGDAVWKESAAYLIDHGGFARVPTTKTGIAKIRKGVEEAGVTQQVGSLQSYVAHLCSAEDFGCSKFSTDDVHRIGLLDCRILNLDRHEGSILVTRDHKLVPIDHGFSFPSWRELEDVFFCWSSWKQAAEPFSNETKKYVAALDPLADTSTLLGHGIRHECVLTYVVCSLLVQIGVAAGLTLRDLGMIMQRNVSGAMELPSRLEVIVSKAASESDFDTFEFVSLQSWDDMKLKHFLRCFVKAARDELARLL